MGSLLTLEKIQGHLLYRSNQTSQGVFVVTGGGRETEINATRG